MKLLLLVALCLVVSGCLTPEATPETPTPPTPTSPGTNMTATAVAVSLVDRTPGAGVPPTTMGISPSSLDLTLNVPVNLTVTNDGASAHNLVIEGLDVVTEDLEPGESVSILFTPTQAGTFVMYCSIGGSSPLGHDAQGMHGEVNVA